MFTLLIMMSLCYLYSANVAADLTATKFNAETHIKMFQNTFANLNIYNLTDFAIAQTSDSTVMDPKIASLLKIFHAACQNHCLNLGCKDMEKNCIELSDLTEKTQDIHCKIKRSNKLCAVLENIQATACEYDSSVWAAGKPKLVAATCWNSLEAMLQSHKKVLDAIREVIHSTPEHDLSDETTSNHFVRRLNKHLKYFAALKSASVCMQTHLATLDDCQFQWDAIADLATDGLGKARQF
jgi:hypothetical protein